MSNYKEQANGYSSNAEVIKAKLTTIKTKYQTMLDGFGVKKINGNLDYTIAEGDYLTEHVVTQLDTCSTDIDSVIGEIDARVSAIGIEAERLDKEEEERLAREKAAREKASTDDTGTSGSDGDTNV